MDMQHLRRRWTRRATQKDWYFGYYCCPTSAHQPPGSACPNHPTLALSYVDQLAALGLALEDVPSRHVVSLVGPGVADIVRRSG